MSRYYFKDRSVSAEKVVCEPNSQPKNLVISGASRLSACPISMTLTNTVLIPFPVVVYTNYLGHEHLEEFSY